MALSISKDNHSIYSQKNQESSTVLFTVLTPFIESLLKSTTSTSGIKEEEKFNKAHGIKFQRIFNQLYI